MVNKVILVGNLGQDPELRHTSGGAAVTTLSVATSRKWKDKSDKMQEETEWHKVTVWNKQGEACAEYLSKGKQVYVEGRIHTNKWEDKEGVTRYTTEIIADNVKFLGGKGEGSGGRKHEDDGPSSHGDELPF
jgi:single-strand DNA-binding protein